MGDQEPTDSFADSLGGGYLFGDSDVAVRRLEVLARVFASSTRAFLAEAGDEQRAFAIDLGCGPGFTTHLIAGALRCDRVLGLDASPHFIELARTTTNDRVSFALHDVCAMPFPSAPADAIFCRFLLTHLRDPVNVVAKWATQLSRDGIIMIEETDSILTRHPTFARYLGIVEAMLASQSNALYAGPIVATLGAATGLMAMRNQMRRLKVINADAARMFVMNMQAWKDGDFIRANYPDEMIRELDDELSAIAQDASSSSDIEWCLRQAIVRQFRR